MATTATIGKNGPTIESNWFTRNWKWVIFLGLVALLAAMVSFIGAIFFLVEISFQHNPCYVEALARARSDATVREKIGQPLKVGWLATGNLNTSGASGDLDLSIPIGGPKGKGTLYVVAKKSAGLWIIQTLQVEVKGERDRIDLLRPEEKPPEKRP
jgi:hypothetical protein